MTHQDLLKSLEIFGLSGRVTLRQIKVRHRELVKRYHPDTGTEGDPERIRWINAAYKILLEYSENYRLSFSEEEFYEQNPEERMRMQFTFDPWDRK